MHPILFLRFLWERVCHPDGLWPWAETNQGLLSFVALALTGALALLEFRRANKAEALALRLAKEAETAEERRASQAIERETRLTREADEKARAAADAARSEEINSFVSACIGIIDEVSREIEAEIRRLKPLIDGASPYESPNYRLERRAKLAGESLNALLPSCPRDPQLIIGTQTAAATLSAPGLNPTSYGAGFLRDWWSDRLKSLSADRAALTDRWSVLVDPRTR